MDLIKWCTQCKSHKPQSEFRPRKDRPHLLASSCKKCLDRKKAEYDKANPEKRRERNRRASLKKKYNLTPERYAEMTENGCEVCGSFDNLHVDHDHACCPGQDTCGACIRGILCSRHNLALGCVQDSVEELQGLAEYLQTR